MSAEPTETIEYDRCRLEIDAPLATYVLANPKQLNAADLDMLEGLSRALLEIKKPRRGIRCLMITGEGKAFCSGANFTRFGEKGAARSAFSVIDGVYHPVIRHLRDVRIPIVAAVNGPAVGFGLALALSSDLSIAARSAFFSVNYRDMGSAPDCGATWFLPHRIGLVRARSMLLRGTRVSAKEALEWGLINEVVDDDCLQDEAAKLAGEIANGPTVALSEMKRLLNQSQGVSLDEQLEAESRAVLVTARTKDNVVGITALRRREVPEFIGQ